MSNRVARWLCIGVVLAPALAVAHPLNLAYLQLRVEASRVSIALTMPGDASAEKLLATVAVSANGASCAVVSRAAAALELACPPEPIATLHLAMPGLEETNAAVQILGKALFAGDEQVFSLDLEHAQVDIHWDTAPSFKRFLMMGVRHIGAWPGEWIGAEGVHLPAGMDHILFLFALLLGGGTLKRTLAMVTGFTLGHSITLALAAFGIAHAPSRLVESAIALSIIYVAIEDFFRATPKHRWQVATFFGLVHGLAFASALTELHLQRGDMAKALIGFNLGVELGQATLVVIIASVFFAIDKLVKPSERTRRRAVQVMAVAIMIPASYWFVQRAFF